MASQKRSVFRKLSPLLQKFQNNTRGNVIMLFALAVIPLSLLIGVAVDFHRASNAKQKMSKLLDSSILMAYQKIAQEPNLDPESTLLAVLSKNWNVPNLPVPDASNVQTLMSEDNKLSVNISMMLPTTFMRIAGKNQMALTAFSEVMAGAGVLELALVLDTTKSMEGTRMDALKLAAKDLVNQLVTPESNGRVKVGLVPFSRNVNVGMVNRFEPWITVPDDTTGSYCALETEYTYDCQNVDVACNIDGVNTTCTEQQCTTTPTGNQVNVCRNWDAKWQGCVSSRPEPLNLQDDSYNTFQIRGLLNNYVPDPAHPLYSAPAISDGACPDSAVTPLSDDQLALTTAIDALVPEGDTYIPGGLMWGWRTLSPQAPFDEATPLNQESMTRVLVLMTDGQNTVEMEDWGNGWVKHDDIDGTFDANHLGIVATNERMTNLCEAIKNGPENIKIYTIAFEVTDPDTKSRLQSCASSPGNYFDAQNSDQLVEAFKGVANSLTALRLTQ